MTFQFPWPAASSPAWFYFDWAMWILSAVFIAWMLVDWYRTDTGYSEDVLTSSREGEIEAMSEKHQIKA
jgi:hypothetical protein